MSHEASPPLYSIYGDSAMTTSYSQEYLENFKRTQVLRQHFFSFLFNHILSGSIIPFASPLLTKLLWILSVIVLACLSTVNLNPFELQDSENFEKIQSLTLYPIANINNLKPNEIYYSPSVILTVFFLIISIWGVFIFVNNEIRKFLTYTQQTLYDIFSEWFCFFALIITYFNCSTSAANYKNTAAEKSGIYLFVPICTILIGFECILGMLRSIYDQRVEKNPMTNTNPRLSFLWFVSISLLIIGKTVYLFGTFHNRIEASWISILLIILSCYSIYAVFSAPGFNTFYRIGSRFTSINFLGNYIISFISIWCPPAGDLWGWLNVVSLLLSIIISIGFELYNRKKAREFVSCPCVLGSRFKFFNYFAVLSADELLEVLTSSYVNDIFFEYPVDYDIQILILRFIILKSEDFDRKRLTIVNLLQKNAQNFHRSIQLLVLLELSEETSEFLTHKKGVYNALYNNVVVASHYFWKNILRENYSDLPKVINWYSSACEDLNAIQKQLAINYGSPGWYGVSYINFISKIYAKVYAIGDINIRTRGENIIDNLSWIEIPNYNYSNSTITLNCKRYSDIEIRDGKISDYPYVNKYKKCNDAGTKLTFLSRICLVVPIFIAVLATVSILIIITSFILMHIPIPNDIKHLIKAQNTLFYLSGHLFWKSYKNKDFVNTSDSIDFENITKSFKMFEEYFYRFFPNNEELVSFGSIFNKHLSEFSKNVGNLSFEDSLTSQTMKDLINSMMDFASACFNRMLQIRSEMHEFTRSFIIIFKKYQIYFTILVFVSFIAGSIGSVVFFQNVHMVYKLATLVPKTESAKKFRILRQYKDIRGKVPELEYQKKTNYEIKTIAKYWIPFVVAYVSIYVTIIFILNIIEQIHDQYEIIYAATTLVPFQNTLLYIIGRLSFVPSDSSELVPWAIFGVRSLLSAIGIDYLPAFFSNLPNDTSRWNISYVELSTLSTDFLMTEASNYSKETYLMINVFSQAVQRALKDLYLNRLNYHKCQFKIISILGNDADHFTDVLIDTNSYHMADSTFKFIAGMIVFIIIILFCVIFCWSTIHSIKETVALVVRLIAGSAITPQLFHDNECHLDYDMSQYDSGVDQILDAIPHGIIFSDKNGKIIYTNEAASVDLDGSSLIGRDVSSLKLDTFFDENGEQRFSSVRQLPMKRFPVKYFKPVEEATTAIIVRDVTESTLMQTKIHKLEDRLRNIRKIVLPASNPSIPKLGHDMEEILDNIAIVDIALPDGISTDAKRSLLEQARDYADQQVTFFYAEVKGLSACFIFTTVGGSAHQRQYLRDALKFARFCNRISTPSRISIVRGEKVFCQIFDSASIGVILYTDAFIRSGALLRFVDPGELIVELDIIRRVTELFSIKKKSGKVDISGRDVHYCIIDNLVVYEGMDSQSFLSTPSAEAQII